MKALAAAAIAIAVAMLALWREVRTPAPAAAAAPPVATARPRAATRPIAVAPPVAAPRPAVDDDDGDDAPIHAGDELFTVLDEVYTRRLLAVAADCYHGGKARKQKLRLQFRWTIHAGTVTVRDVRVAASTLGDPELERCMTRAVAAARFHDPRLPDWSTRADEDETLLVRIDGLARFAAAD